MSTAALELIIRLKDQASKELAGLADRVREVGAAAKDAESKSSGLGAGISGLGGVAKTAAVGLAAAGVAVASVGTAMVRGNAEFERYQTQFKVLLGSAEAAKQRLAEDAKFAADTPFELPDVVKADKVLTGFRIRSKELLATVGDVAAGVGESFSEMAGLVGRFSAGATGEAISRFQELGITTRKELAELGLKFSKSGELLSPLPQAMEVVTKIMRDRFGGMMQAQSQTLEGMISNLQDWIGQATRTLGAPLFDVVKAELKDLLTYLNEPATQEGLKNIAQNLAEGLKTAVPVIVSGVKAVAGVIGTLADVLVPLAGVVADNFMPALVAAGAALTTYAGVALVSAIPAETALLTIIMQTIPAMVAQAAAAAAAAAPFVLVAAAVYGMAKAWQEYNGAHQAALDKLLESRKWWTDSEQALKSYDQASGSVKAATAEQAAALKQLTDAQREQLDSLARRMEAGLVSEDQYKAEMAAINAQIPAIQAATDALNKQRLEVGHAGDWTNDGLVGLENMTTGAGQLGAQLAMTAEQAKTLADALARIDQAGTAALSNLIPLTSNFLASINTAASEHATRVAAIVKDSNTQFGQIAAARAKIMADAGKAFGKIESDLSSKLADIAKSTSDKLGSIEQQRGEKLADIAAATADKLKSIETALGAKLADINKATGQKIADINKQSAQRLAAIDKAAIDERMAAYTALQRAISTSMADMVAQQEANDLDLAGATGDRLAELRRRETTEAASRQRLATAAIEAQQRAAKGEAVIAGKVYAIRQEGISKQAALDDAYAKRREELANDPAALAELKRQYDEAIAAEQAAEQQRIAIAEAEQREKEAQREQERAEVRQAQAEQIAATRQAAAEQIAAAKEAAAEQRRATLEAAAKQRADAEKQAAEQIAATEKQAAAQRQAALEQAAEQRRAAGEQLAEQRRANDEQLAAAAQARAEKLAAEQASYQQQQQQQAEAYAREAAAQREHLGVLLIDRVNAMAAAGLVTKEQAEAMTATLKTEYGVAETNAALTFGKMSATLDAWAANGGKNADAYTGKLHTIETQSVATQQKLDAMAKEYAIKILEDFNTHKINAQQYADALARIPAQVRTQLDLEMVAKLAPIFAPGPRRNGGEVGDDTVVAPKLPRRALGGPVSAGRAYIVGEKRPELFVPKQSGTILPNLDRFTTMPVGQPTMLPEPGRRGDYSTIRVNAPITFNMPAGSGGGNNDLQALGAEFRAIAEDVFEEAINRVIARDL